MGHIIMAVTYSFGIILYSFNKVVFLLNEMSQTLGTEDRSRLGTEWTVLPSRPTQLRLEMLWAPTEHHYRCAQGQWP